MACSVNRMRSGILPVLAAALLAAAAGPCGAEEGAAAPQAPAAPAGAEAASDAPKDFDPLPLIGLDLAAAYAAFGVPWDVFPFEQAVVFYYPDHKYLFWFQNRVWQVRVDRRYPDSAMGFRMGDSKAEATARIGRLFQDLGDAVSFRIESAGYPMEARLVFEDGRLADLYVYRSDW